MHQTSSLELRRAQANTLPSNLYSGHEFKALPSNPRAYISHTTKQQGSHCFLWMIVCLHTVASVLSDTLQIWTVACQAPLPMGFSRLEYWSGLPCPSPGDLLDPWTEPKSPVSPALQVNTLPTEPPGKPLWMIYVDLINYPWKKSYDQPRQHIEKQKHYFANHLVKVHLVKAMVFPI